MLLYVFIPLVGDLRLKVCAEYVVCMLLLEVGYHLQFGGVIFYFQLVSLRQLYGMEERVFDVFALQGDANVVDDVGERTFCQHGGALPLLRGGRIGALHQLPDALVFERGDLYHGDAKRALQFFRIDLVAVLFYRVDHIERDDNGDVDLQELRRQIQVALQIGRIDDVDDAVGLFVDDKVARNDLFRRIRRERIDAGEVYDVDRRVELFISSLALVDGDARPVAHVRGTAGEGVEQGGLAAVRVARQCKF